MPKEGAMAQISRPFQIALVAVVLIAAVWFVALRGHSSSTSSSSNESSAPAPAAASPSSSASGAGSSSAAAQSASSSSGGSSASQGTGTYHGSAPGVDGLTRAIAKARGAVSESERHAKALAQKSAEASGEAKTPSGSSTASVQHAATTGGTAAKHSTTKTHSGSSAASANSAASKAATGQPTIATDAKGIPLLQARVEGELKQGKVAALLFWNPKGAVDKTVRRELQAAGGKLHGKLAISVARASEVGLFGSFTRSVQVYGTPTILLVNHAGKTASVTGLTDVFSIEQAVKEVKQAK
jgi:hypothetical protein